MLLGKVSVCRVALAIIKQHCFFYSWATRLNVRRFCTPLRQLLTPIPTDMLRDLPKQTPHPLTTIRSFAPRGPALRAGLPYTDPV